MAAHDTNYKTEKEPSKQQRKWKGSGEGKETLKAPWSKLMWLKAWSTDQSRNMEMEIQAQNGDTDSGALVLTHTAESAF